MRRQSSFAVAATITAAVLALTLTLSAEAPTLPQDQGYVALIQELQQLRTTARMIHTTAHPDDEDGGMMTLESRGHGTEVMLLTLTRGEGGQNKSGSVFPDELGVLRTLELLAAGQYYGVEQRFTRVADFGFSKNAPETLNNWHNGEPALEDMVRIIRTYRPDVIVSRFQGQPRDGHGNHQAAGVVTQQAFRAAADPKKFPEQIKQGLLPWQAKKLYMDNVRANEEWNVRFDTGEYSPLLGMSYAQFAVEGLAHQTSQGVGGARLPAGHRYTYYKRIDSVLPADRLKDKEEDFFDGLETTIPGLAQRLGREENEVGWLRPLLTQMQADVDSAWAAVSPEDPSHCATPLLHGLATTNEVIARLESADISSEAKQDILPALRAKLAQFERAANLALGMELDATVDPPGGNQPPGPFGPRLEQTFLAAVPGQKFNITARLYNRSRSEVRPAKIEVEAPEGWSVTSVKDDLKPLAADDVATAQFEVTVADNAQFTRPYWYREDPYKETIERVATPAYEGLALPPWPLRVRAEYRAGDKPAEIESIVKVRYVDPLSGQQSRELAIEPAYSVETEDASGLIAAGQSKPFSVSVNVRSIASGASAGTLRLAAPVGWRVTPADAPLKFEREGSVEGARFTVTPPASNVTETHYPVTAVFDAAGKKYSEAVEPVSRADLGTFYFYRPAKLDVSAVDVKLPQGLKIGYIMGAGDDIPPLLRQLGLDVTTISEQELASGDLARYGTIIVGIRAYDVRPDVAQNNRRLLDYVQKGGRLVVLYQKDTRLFNEGHFTPYTATLTDQRASVEEAPVEMLDPQNAIWRAPNAISQRDFAGWVQERGVNFMNDWDSNFTPLLASGDPGEQPLKGGLLVAKYGQGTYIYTGLAFFRQLPAGVPGATRLFVNLITPEKR
jgi:LmbE family N-acetylglucosaminyl deacetylase